MTWRVLWSNTASERLEERALWLAERSPQAAERMLDHLDAAVAQLARFPYSAPLWSRVPALAVRALVVSDFVLYFDVLEESRTLLILTLRHQREREPTSASLALASREDPS